MQKKEKWERLTFRLDRKKRHVQSGLKGFQCLFLQVKITLRSEMTFRGSLPKEKKG
jgi:hypothetical protein